jgi:hypothetical protein
LVQDEGSVGCAVGAHKYARQLLVWRCAVRLAAEGHPSQGLRVIIVLQLQGAPGQPQRMRTGISDHCHGRFQRFHRPGPVAYLASRFDKGGVGCHVRAGQLKGPLRVRYGLPRGLQGQVRTRPEVQRFGVVWGQGQHPV